METVLSARNIIKKYNNIPVVNDLSFDVYKGEIFGFLGPNGAGKTTTMKILSGLLKPDCGELIRMCMPDRLGICPQNIVVWENLTCLEQLSFMGGMHGLSNSQAKAKGWELLSVLGLEEKKNKLAKTLSGGMQRRLNIALALIHNPEIVFLDEPQAGLDPQSRLLVRDYIKSIKEKTTIILTTHDMEEAEKLADRICIIDKGKVLVAGTLEEIKRTAGHGDLLEVEISGAVKKDVLPYLKTVMGQILHTTENTISFEAENTHELLIEIMQVVKERRIQLENLRLRKRSLEDIFIGLTGRGLRE